MRGEFWKRHMFCSGWSYKSVEIKTYARFQPNAQGQDLILYTHYAVPKTTGFAYQLVNTCSLSLRGQLICDSLPCRWLQRWGRVQRHHAPVSHTRTSPTAHEVSLSSPEHTGPGDIGSHGLRTKRRSSLSYSGNNRVSKYMILYRSVPYLYLGKPTPIRCIEWVSG